MVEVRGGEDWILSSMACLLRGGGAEEEISRARAGAGGPEAGMETGLVPVLARLDKAIPVAGRMGMEQGAVGVPVALVALPAPLRVRVVSDWPIRLRECLCFMQAVVAVMEVAFWAAWAATAGAGMVLRMGLRLPASRRPLV